MSDIRCPDCGEPVDVDEFHDAVPGRYPTFSAAVAAFTLRGCPALGWRCGDGSARPEVRTIYDLLGDDVDGAAAALEDL